MIMYSAETVLSFQLLHKLLKLQHTGTIINPTDFVDMILFKPKIMEQYKHGKRIYIFSAA
jgi:hypothetical protein